MSTPRIIRKCNAFSGRPASQLEARHSTRVSLELGHRWAGTWMQVMKPLRLSDKSPFSGQATLDHLQDCCNKSVAIYLPPLSCRASYVYDTIYQQWFHGHQTDIEFGTYLAIIIHISTYTTEDILCIHRSVCDDIVNFQKLLDKYDGATTLGNRGQFEVNWRQRSYYHLRPLFRALVIVADPHTDKDGPQGDKSSTVRIIRTGHTEGLSAPILFNSIPASESTVDLNKSMEISITLISAIRFVMALERCEADAFPTEARKRPLDQSSSGLNLDQSLSGSNGASVEDLDGPSSKWVHCPGYGFPDPLAEQAV